MTTPQSTSTEQQLNLLFGSYKAEWLRGQVFDLFAEPSYFPELKTSRPCVLMGGRGTGKTTVLRGLTYEGQVALSNGDFRTFRDLSFIGLYHRVNTNIVTAFQGPEASEDQWHRLFAHYLNLVVCELIIGFLDWHSTQAHEEVSIAASSCECVAKSLHLGHCQDFAGLRNALRLARIEFEARINNIGAETKGGQQLSIQGAPIDVLSSAVLDNPSLHGKQFFILLDEYENFLDYQQRVVNTLIKHSSDQYTFKIGVRVLGWRQRTTLNENEKLISPSDYVIIPIEERLEGDVFSSFAERVCNSRLGRVSPQANCRVLPVKNALVGMSEDEEARVLGVSAVAGSVRSTLVAEHPAGKERAIIDTLSELQLVFLKTWAEGHGTSLRAELAYLMRNRVAWETRFLNYKHAILFAIRKGKRGIRKYYCGWDVFTKLAAGNIRYLLELVDRSYVRHIEDKKGLDEPIHAEIQTRVAQDVAKKNLTELEGLSVDGAQLTKLLLGLGRVFQVMASDVAGHAPEVNQFSMKEETRSRARSDLDIERLLTSAVMHLALIRAPGNKLADAGETRAYDYMIHPIFCPFFEYSHRRKRKLQLSDADFVGLVTTPRDAIRRILARSNRKGLAPLPDQLLLFETYYEEIG